MFNQIRRQIRRHLARRLDVPEIPSALERLKAQGFAPKRIFDVGAYEGEFAIACLKVWGETNVTCFEPLAEKQAALQRLQQASGNQLSVHQLLLGASRHDEVTFYQRETASSVLVEHECKSFPQSVCRMETIDFVVSMDSTYSNLDFIKIDAQGYELEILKGAENALPKVKVILAEINFLDIHVAVPLHAEITSWLYERNFVAFDICGFTRRPLDRALWQIDMIFVPSDSPLRLDKRWTA